MKLTPICILTLSLLVTSCATTLTCTPVGTVPRPTLEGYTVEIWKNMSPEAKRLSNERGLAWLDWADRVDGRINLHDDKCD